MGLCNQVFKIERLPQGQRGTETEPFVHVCIREAHGENVQHYSKFWPLGEGDR